MSEIMEEAVKYLKNHPESAYEEYETTAYIRNVCKGLGLQIIDIGMETGVVAYLDTGSNQCIALRADIDAVPVGGSGSHGEAERAARHICGHHVHTACLLGAAQALTTGEKPGVNVLFLFQPAEECTSGAKAMLDAGLLDKIPMRPDAVFGIHNRPELPVGEIAIHQGPLMSAKSNWRLVITGKSGHGGEPHNCIDPITAAGAFISGANTIIGRNVDPNRAAVCSVLSIRCGTEDNQVPAEAVLTGTIRSFEPDVHERMKERLTQLAKGLGIAYECSMELTWVLDVPAVFNSSEMTARARRITESLQQAHAIRTVDTEPALGTDDFAVFQQAVPGFYFWVGSGKPDGSSPAWHKPDFCIEPGYEKIAADLLAACVRVL